MKLTPKHGKFITQVLLHGNVKLAAQEAGVPAKGAAVTGARWMKDPAIRAAIDERMKKAEISDVWILGELRKIAGHDAGKRYDKDGNPIPVHLLDDDTRAAVVDVEDEVITKVESDVEGGKETVKRTKLVTHRQRIKIADKVRCLELLGKHKKLFTDNVEYSGRVTLEQLVSGENEAA